MTSLEKIIFIAIVTLGITPVSAQCPNGNCSRYWNPRTGYKTQCANGKCNRSQPSPAKTEEREETIEAELTICGIVSELVNQHREKMGLPPLSVDADLCSGCESHSKWMANGGGFRHSYGIGGKECIAYGVRTPEAVVRLWLNSSGHRAIILGRGSKIGVGFSGTFWTLRVR